MFRAAVPRLRAINNTQPIKKRAPSWRVYNLEHIPAQFIGTIENAPDEQTAIARAIKKFNIPSNERGRLIAQRRGD
jgi:hypothetical protein